MRLEHLLSGEILNREGFFLYCTVVCLIYIREKDEAESNYTDKVELNPKKLVL